MKKKSAFHSVRRNFRQGGFFKLRVLFGVLLCFAGVTIVLLALGKASAQPRTPAGQVRLQKDGLAVANKIAPWVMEHTANGQAAEFFVVLADQADLSPADNFQTKAEKGRYVYDTLLNKAQTTQAPVLQWLRERSIEHQSFYIVNAILVNGNREVAEALAARPEVARVEGNPLIHNDLPQPGPIEKSPPQVPATIEPGINYTHAPQVWALGFTGQNIVIASADTGNRWTHNALKPHYRGWDGVNANHNYNWHDSIHNSSGNPCGNDSPFPCDDFFHGSHTLGTAIGDDGMGNQIGMAPGAKWIGCRNMDNGNGTPARYMECMEFFLAPYPINCTPAQGDPTKAPDITINSWGCPASEGCSVNTLQASVEAQAAAGIQMVVAAGNSGSACSTVSDPPSFYAASYTAGALNTGTDTIAGFSSRGPVTVDGSNRIKPDISAPGTGTRSASNAGDNAYTTASGTSMATPHIAGAMGLLWCALPSLRHQITASRDALNSHAVFISSTQCGTAGPPNNVYGWGRVDIAAAVGTPSPTPSPSPIPTATGTPSACGAGTATPTPTGSPTCIGQYAISQIGGSIVPGTMDIGNHGDDTVTTIALPFPYCLYGNTYTSVNLSSNGNAQFVTNDTAFTNQCLPWTAHNDTICPYWDDLYLVNSGFGIFTSVSGTAPNRIFNIEWRAQYFPGSGSAGFELRLYEGQCRFDVIYGTVSGSNTSATAGVQRDDSTFVQYFCNGSGGAATGGQSYILTPCGTPSPTPTATATATATATPTATATHPRLVRHPQLRRQLPPRLVRHPQLRLQLLPQLVRHPQQQLQLLRRPRPGRRLRRDLCQVRGLVPRLRRDHRNRWSEISGDR